MMTGRPALLFSVEHGDNRVPPEFAALFVGLEAVLSSHRGYDPGAGELALRFAARFHAPLFRADVTRLLVDQNRSVTNRRSLFSEYSRSLAVPQKEQILETYYRPYRRAVIHRAAELLDTRGSVLHLAIHSFTPELQGRVRNCDIGLMYDPSRNEEKTAALRWQEMIARMEPSLRVRRNYPYRGDSDGIIRSLRRHFADERYVGLQIEINQKHPFGDRDAWKAMQKIIVESFGRALARDGR